MRARQPDDDGRVDSDGVTIGYEVYGDGSPTVLLMPTWTIVHSRLWKAQIAYLARHHRVVTFDGPGNGRSDRPVDPAAYSVDAVAGAAVAVMDATGTEGAVIVSLSKGANWSLKIAADNPDRVLGQVFIGPSVALAPLTAERAEIARTFFAQRDDPQGWQKYNAHYWLAEYEEFAEFFFSQCFPEPHSTKQREDTVGWAAETTAAVLLADAQSGSAKRDTVLRWCARIDCPVMVIHGTDDRISPLSRGEALAAETNAELIVLEGCGHIPLARDPVRVNRMLHDFVDRVRTSVAVDSGGPYLGRRQRRLSASTPMDTVRVEWDPQDPNSWELRRSSGAASRSTAPSRARRSAEEGRTTRRSVWTRGMDRDRRALFLSSPIGLGHVRRDLAIAEQLRVRHPDLQIDWLAQHPVTKVLAAAGETIHPASRWLASESGHIASEATGHDLHCFQALRRMDEILVANFMVFQEVVEDGVYDLVVGDEAWDVDHFWHENPELKRGAHVWFTDFVGYLPMPDGGEHEAHLTADYNAEMIQHIDRFPRIRDRAVFVGNLGDVIPETFGPDLPKIRDWTEAHFDFPGYITGFTPPTPDEAVVWRVELGYEPHEKVCVVTVGGSGVGRDLLEKTVAAYPLAKRAVPELRMVVVAGPRIDPAGLAEHPGLEVHGYVDDLYRHLSVCDLAVVHGGLTTTMELTAARRPFLYFPLQQHFEQTYHVRHRLDQYRAGRHMDYAATDPDALAAAIVAEVGRDVDYRQVETDGAERAAGMIAELL